MSDAATERVFEELLHSVERAALAGKTEAALALLRALTRQYPHEARGWLALAHLSNDEDERRAARERAIALNPARAALAAPDELDFVEDAFDEEADAASQRARVAPWLLYALALLLLLAVALPLFRLWRDAGTGTGVLEAPPAAETTPAIDATAQPAGGVSTAPPTAATAPPSPTPTAQPTAALPPTPQPTLAPGALAQFGDWRASLLRPDYSLFLDGGLGGQQPQGRFLLVLLALSNTAGAPQVLPPELLVLHDAQGRTYTPPPALSTLYLATYGRGQRGDLSLENELPAGGGLYSVPVIYDVPADASGLQLSLGDASGGAWPIGP